jgi:phosphatidylethanolamine-binding protein (PEBP) family uncharacterized protein
MTEWMLCTNSHSLELARNHGEKAPQAGHAGHRFTNSYAEEAPLGLNDFKKTGCGGPPVGRHRYFHKLYALDITLDLKGAMKSQIERAMQDHVLANAELIGTYQKSDR